MSDASSAHAPTVLMQQAYEQLQEGRLEEAVETFSASLVVAPRHANALRGRGVAYLQLKRWDLAAADFEAVRSLAPDDLDSWVNLATSLSMQPENTYHAMTLFDELLSTHPDSLQGHWQVGLLHLRLGAIPKGRQHLQQALTCRPTLGQRRQIEAILHEQATLDRTRYYRPDFEALHQQEAQQSMGRWSRLRAWWTRGRRGSS